MRKLLHDVVKGATVAFCVGAVLAVALPHLAIGLGFAATATEATATLGWSASPLWLGAFFGGWGLLSPIFTSAVDYVFGDGKTNEAAPSVTQEKSAARQVNINIQQAPSQMQGQALVDAKHQQDIKAKRLIALISGEQTPGV